MGTEVSLFYAVDRNYLLPLAVSACSLLENFPPGRDLRLFVLHDRIPEAELEPLRSSLAPFLRRGLSLELIAWDPSTLAHMRTTLHFSRANFARILAPALLPPELKKAVYLDADTLVLADISELFDLDPSPWVTMLAPDWTGTLGHPLLELPADLSRWGASHSDRNFNSGVQLMNLERWRAEKVTDQLLAEACRHPELLFIADQNLTNVCLRGRIGELDPRWNKQFIYRKIREGEWKMPFSEHAWSPPHIVHFVSEEKPWLPGCSLPEKQLFYSYWKKTKFPFLPPG